MSKVMKNKDFSLIKETRFATMDIFRKKNTFLFKSFVKIELSYVFTINMFSTAAWNSELSNKNRRFFFLLLGIIYVPPIILDR